MLYVSSSQLRTTTTVNAPIVVISRDNGVVGRAGWKGVPHRSLDSRGIYVTRDTNRFPFADTATAQSSKLLSRESRREINTHGESIDTHGL